MITHIALVLPVPVDVVDGEGVGVADLGVLEPLDVTLEGEELSVGSRIEREQTVSTFLYSHVRSTASAQPPQYVELAAQLFRNNAINSTRTPQLVHFLKLFSRWCKLFT